MILACGATFGLRFRLPFRVTVLFFATYFHAPKNLVLTSIGNQSTRQARNEEAAMTDQEAQKIRRPAVTYCIHEKSETDFRVLHGNKIVSRHTTEAAAQAALDVIFRKPQAA